MSVVALKRVSLEAPGWPVIVQLARREGVRLIRHPVLLGGGLLSLALFGLLTWQAAPILHRDDTNVAGALLPLAAATLIAANLAASRAARNGTDELYDGTATSAAIRTTGHLLSLAFALVAAAGVGGVMFVYMLLDDPVGIPRISEILVGPLSVALLGAIGIALGRWKPHPALGPLAVVIVIALEILLIQPIIGLQGTAEGVASRGPWFALWVPLSLTSEVPPELVIRPGDWHLLYLGGLVLSFAALALARHGPGRSVIALLAAGAAGIVLGSIGQLTPPEPAQRAALAALVEHPEEHQVCEQRRGVTYCAYRAYGPWIDRWARPIEGALERIPPDARPEGLVVRQTFGSYFEGPTDLPTDSLRKIERAQRRSFRATPDALLVGDEAESGAPVFWTRTEWGRGETEGEYEIGLALYVAMEAVDFPSTRAEIPLSPRDITMLKETAILPVPSRAKAKRRLKPGRRWSTCHTAGQARAVIAWWIAGQSTAATRATVARVAADNPYGLMIYEVEGKRFATYIGPFIPLHPKTSSPMGDWVSFTDADFHYAAELMKRPADEVETIVTDHWDELTAPTSPIDRFLPALGLTPHPTLQEQIAALPDDIELEAGRKILEPHTAFGTIPCV